jgi:ribosomal-protein-alanine N-acetyltransferase
LSLLAYPSIPLRDSLVLLRPWQQEDLACVIGGKDLAASEASVWIDRQQRRRDSGQGLSLAIADARTEEAAGYVGFIFRPKLELGTLNASTVAEAGDVDLVFRPQPGTVGIGYWTIEKARGRGFATHAVGLLARWGLTDGLLERVEALIEPDNIASVRVAEKAGFSLEGRLRSYLEHDGSHFDACVYSMIRADLS